MRTGLTAAGLVLAGALLGGCTTAAPERPPATEAPPATADAPPGGTPSAADVVARLAPSVVTVGTGEGVGSGVVYQPDVVLTNQHVVAGATRVTIDYADGTSSDGTVLATDEVTDLAVIRTARGGLPVPEYRTELPRPGDPVLAIGSPLGFEGTVTSGIVSALNRQIPGSATQSSALVDLIQVDAAISPGNSGGALLDASGRVIGINEAYIPPAAGAVSLGFAIPAATAVDIADQLLADGTATHSVLGVNVARLTPEIIQAYDLGVESGALVTRVPPGGPAAAAGVQAGDVIVALGDQEVGSIEDLLGALRDTDPGQQTTVAVSRDGQRMDLPVTIGSESG
ncbi:S1C family serine protease [Pseudonocardia sichuanensis]|uniref:S1-C subfamily serine protease n=1 Tax=Pseudonocardia kunmingensis TaxID=630975 RepID=A0A543DX35_9PSEU|nr:trypsin-like peptidase domain-containing protein [Pseudonocardia kunmingensis]TQM13809.1 S1-C subfamily serine protease [Pseudonocardia kunmingensis]